MRRRDFIKAIAGSAVVWPLTVRAQQAERMRRIGVLTGTRAEDPEVKARRAAFEQALQQLGWTPGRNVRIDYRFAEGDAATSRKQAEELVALAPDVIVSHWQLFDRTPTSGHAHGADRVRVRPRSSRLRFRR
jgi:putative tryptophan/tyrosine transport system substrate-binding protein